MGLGDNKTKLLKCHFLTSEWEPFTLGLHRCAGWCFFYNHQHSCTAPNIGKMNTVNTHIHTARKVSELNFKHSAKASYSLLTTTRTR